MWAGSAWTWRCGSEPCALARRTTCVCVGGGCTRTTMQRGEQHVCVWGGCGAPENRCIAGRSRVPPTGSTNSTLAAVNTPPMLHPTRPCSAAGGTKPSAASRGLVVLLRGNTGNTGNAHGALQRQRRTKETPAETTTHSPFPPHAPGPAQARRTGGHVNPHRRAPGVHGLTPHAADGHKGAQAGGEPRHHSRRHRSVKPLRGGVAGEGQAACPHAATQSPTRAKHAAHATHAMHTSERACSDSPASHTVCQAKPRNATQT